MKGLSKFEEVKVAVTCECGFEPWAFIKCGVFLD